MLRKLFAVFLSLFFVLLSQPLVLGWGAYNSFLNRDFYDDEFVDLVYDYSISTISTGVDISNFPSVDVDSFKNILLQVLIKDDLAKIIDSVYNDISNVRKNDIGELELRIPMDWVFDKLPLISGLIADNLYENLEPCAESVSSADFVMRFDCLDSSLDLESLKSAVLTSLDLAFYSDLPRELGFSIAIPENVESSMIGLKSKIESMISSFVFVLSFLLVLIAVLIFKPWDRVLTWVVRPLFVSSFMFLLLVLFLNFIPEFIDLIDSSSFSSLPETQVNLGIGIYKFLISGFTNSIILFVLPTFVLSLFGWIFLFFYSRKHVDLISTINNDTQ